jgi:putative PIN family toxin of toxin-antitoxin system
LIPAFAFPGSKSQQAFLLAVNGKIVLFISPAIIAETANRLREKFQVPENQILIALKQIGKTAEVIRPELRIDILEDDPDNRILECAVAAKADLIVTGDKHLLKLNEFRGIGIARVADLLRTVGE